MTEKKQEVKYNRKLWFRRLKTLLRLFIKEPEFVYLGEEMKDQAFFLSNHVGSSVPLAMELYSNVPFRFWGTYEMNSSLPTVYRYLSYTYYYKKQHWNLTLARLFCLIAAPLVWVFYRGLNLIPTYPDMRFHKTIRESLDVLKDDQSLVIFPEHSADGYFDELVLFHPGFVLMAEQSLKAGMDLPVFLAYYRKPERRFIVDKPMLISELLKIGETREAIAEKLRIRCNELGRMKLAH